MEIRKDSWHYKFWARTYNPKPLLRKQDCSRPPYQTSICAYVNRIIWVAPWVYLFAGLAWFVLLLLLVVVVGGATALSLIFGWIWRLNSGVYEPERYVSPLRIRGFNIYPYHFLILGLVWALATGWIRIPKIVYMVALCLMALTIVAALINYFEVTYHKLNPAKEKEHGAGAFTLLKAYLKAKKDRICPVITFTDPAESSS